MPFDATHIVFAHEAARAADPRLLRPELLAGAIAPDSVGTARYLPMAASHLRIRGAERLYARAAVGEEPALRAFAFGYLSHVWLDRFIPRWRPRGSLLIGGRRLALRGLYPLLARRDAEEALRIWRRLGGGAAPLDHAALRFVDPRALQAYRDGAEARLLATPPLEPDESAPASFMSERVRAEALREFSRDCRTTDPRVL
jgi:hypothetical protein